MGRKQGVLLSWGDDSFSDEQHDVLCEIIYHVLQEIDANIYIVCRNGNTVAQYLLNEHNIQSPRITYLIEPQLGGIWSRDFGPITIYENYVDNFSFMDWQYYPNVGGETGDGEVPQLLADYLNIQRYENNDIEFESGNFMCDGHGTAFSTDGYDNTHELFNGITSSRWLDVNPLPFPYPNYNTDHIDIFMKMLDEETILVGRFSEGDNDYGLNDDIDANIAMIQKQCETHFGRQYKIHTIPMPSPTLYDWGDGLGWTFRSYTNSLIINKLVLVPTYDHIRDNEAIAIYETLMPGYTVVPINCTALDGSGGAIHCVTMGIGASSPIYIEHAKIRAYKADEDIDHTGPYEIRALMKSQPAISSAFLYWSNSPGTGYQQLPLVHYGSDNYLAYIPPQAPGNTVYYYLSASNNEKTVTKPIPADDGAYIGFQVDADANPPVNLSFSDEEVKSGIEVEFQASNSITTGSNYVIKNGADVTFTAGNSITLNGGTSIELGAAFCADVDPNFINSLAKRVATTGGSASTAHSQDESKEQGEEDQSSHQEKIPMQFSLSQNYPNPFNPTTTIQYTLKEDCHVSLKIYNISGQEVRTLVNEYQPAGYKATIWDGRNSSEQPVPSGIYLYKIRAADFTEYKKMVLVK
jgi:agmatine/peptidylarginine deiminase